MRPCWRSYDADGTLPKTQPVQSRRSASFSRDSRRGGQKRREPAGHQSPRLHRAETQSVRHQSVINHRPVSQMSSVGPLPWVWSASKMRRSQSVMLSLEVRGFLREARPGGERRGLWLFSASFRKEQHLSLTSITSLSDLEVSRWSRSTLVTGHWSEQRPTSPETLPTGEKGALQGPGCSSDIPVDKGDTEEASEAAGVSFSLCLSPTSSHRPEVILASWLCLRTTPGSVFKHKPVLHMTNSDADSTHSCSTGSSESKVSGWDSEGGSHRCSARLHRRTCVSQERRLYFLYMLGVEG